MDSRPILLVEDNPDDVELTVRALKKNNITNEVVIARDGAEALNLLSGDWNPNKSDAGLHPSLVLLDLKLPNVDGFEVLMKMRGNESTNLVPVVVLTSSKEDRDLLRAYTLGANSYVRKPVDYVQFLSTIQLLGTYWLSVNEPLSNKEESG